MDICGAATEQEEQLVYLTGLITADSSSDKDTQRRTGLSQSICKTE